MTEASLLRAETAFEHHVRQCPSCRFPEGRLCLEGLKFWNRWQTQMVREARRRARA